MLETIELWQIELLVLDSNTWNHLNVCAQMSSGFFRKMLPTNNSLKNHMYKPDLALNNPQWLICHKTQLTNIFIYHDTCSKELFYCCHSGILSLHLYLSPPPFFLLIFLYWYLLALSSSSSFTCCPLPDDYFEEIVFEDSKLRMPVHTFFFPCLPHLSVALLVSWL